MKRDLIISVIALAIVAFCFSMTPAFAADQVITFKPSSVSVQKDRNGQEYVRMIWGDTKELDGIKYSGGSTVNAYREHVSAAKQIKPGTEVTAVVSKRDYNGNVYYTVLAFKPTTAAKK